MSKDPFEDLSKYSDGDLAMHITNINAKAMASQWMSGNTPFLRQVNYLLDRLENELYERHYRLSLQVEMENIPDVIEFDPDLRAKQFEDLVQKRKAKTKKQGTRSNRQRRRAGPDSEADAVPIRTVLAPEFEITIPRDTIPQTVVLEQETKPADDGINPRKLNRMRRRADQIQSNIDE